MNKGDIIKKNAEVVKALPNVMFRVILEGTKQEILAYASGNLRKRFIKIHPGDKVSLEMSPHDPTKARIVYRYKRQHHHESKIFHKKKK